MKLNFVTRLLLIIFILIFALLIMLTLFLRNEIRVDILEEKKDKLFGLAIQLDNYMEGSFQDIIDNQNSTTLSRKDSIEILNNELKDITDFVASGNSGVGIGYYSKKLNAIITYGPSKKFQYTVGTSIAKEHQGLIVMDTGEAMVQTGELVRGNIMNCMYPIIRKEKVIGYIWANETVDRVESQLSSVMSRVNWYIILIFIAIYLSVYIVSSRFLRGISILKNGIENLIDEPNLKLPEIGGELNIIGETVNKLVESISFVRSYNKYILDAVINGVLAVSNEGRITHINRKFFNIFEHLDEEIIGVFSQNVFEMGIQELIKKGLEEGIFYKGKEIILYEKVIQIYSNRVIDESENKLGLVLVFRDITLIKKYEKELNEKERLAALGEMSLGVAHEIKNPLTSVKGFTQMLKRSSLKEEKRISYLEIMEEELNRVNRLLNELLLYGGQSPLLRQMEDISDLIDGLVIEHKMVNNKICFTKKEIGKDDFILFIDKHKIIQVFENIINNSLDAMEKKKDGQLDIVLKAEGESVFVSFRDNGFGISKSNMSKVFNPFFTTKDKGTGFGLPLCYRIVNKHEGSIEILSEEGFYTEVIVKLNRIKE